MMMDKDPELWSFYMLQFLSLFYNNVEQDSELFRFFQPQAPAQSIFSRLVWLHCCFTLIPIDILSILRFFNTLTDVCDEKLTEDDMIKMFSTPMQLAEKVVNTLFTTLKSIAEKYVGNENSKFEEKVKNMLPKYNSLVCKN